MKISYIYYVLFRMKENISITAVRYSIDLPNDDSIVVIVLSEFHYFSCYDRTLAMIINFSDLMVSVMTT